MKNYRFSYEDKSGKKSVFLQCYDDETGKDHTKRIGDIKKLIKYLNYGDFDYADVFFDGFSPELINYVFSLLTNCDINYAFEADEYYIGKSKEKIRSLIYDKMDKGTRRSNL